MEKIFHVTIDEANQRKPRKPLPKRRNKLFAPDARSDETQSREQAGQRGNHGGNEERKREFLVFHF
jgi:hypothetical protein